MQYTCPPVDLATECQANAWGREMLRFKGNTVVSDPPTSVEQTNPQQDHAGYEDFMSVG